MTVSVSPLPKTWLIDIDGTIFRHNGHLAGEDKLLPGVLEFIAAIPEQDRIILLTARGESLREVTLSALARHGVRYHEVLFSLPVGERLLINDRKPSGLATAHAINIDRDVGLAGLIDEIQVADI
jgi:ribonucleotide monophosphatase NagD (HAD superfamily)